MTDGSNKILIAMLERLYASLTSGPVMNCRPHSSRQRIDLAALARFDDSSAASLIAKLLGTEREAKLAGKASPPAVRSDSQGAEAAHQPWDDQQALLSKLRTIAEDAKTYEQDTGAQVLFVGFPLLSVPPDPRRSGRFGATKRVVAPIAFVPVKLAIKTQRPQTVTLSCAEDGADRVVANAALLAWLEQQTGKKVEGLFLDEEGTQPWREIEELVRRVCEALEIPAPSDVGPSSEVRAVPKNEDEQVSVPRILSSAVLGLFPVSNQGLLRDLEALVDGEPARGPIESFLRAGVGLGRSVAAVGPRDVAGDRLISQADPCQARAVRLARESTGLVVHGPPGTGKSQTIANIIGDHLARGERVLFVCDKRTALDVVHHRLDRLGIGSFCAIVHDAQRDQRELYKSIREQLEGLPEARTNAAAVAELRAVDAELAKLHAELTTHHAAISRRPSDESDPSLHELTGEWFSIDVPDGVPAINEIRGVKAPALIPLERHVREMLERTALTKFPNNPWCEALGLDLQDYLAQRVEHWRDVMEEIRRTARAVDEAVQPSILPFDPTIDVAMQGEARAGLAERLAPLLERDGDAVARWASQAGPAVAQITRELDVVTPQVTTVESTGLDPELAVVVRPATTNASELALWLARVAAYLLIARKWYRFLFFGRNRDARAVMQRFGLALTAGSAERVSNFLAGVRARRILQDFAETTLRLGPGVRERDAELTRVVRAHGALFVILRELEGSSPLGAPAARIRTLLTDRTQHAALLEGLRASPRRARAIVNFELALTSSRLFGSPWLAEVGSSLRGGGTVLTRIAPLEQHFGDIEGLLRIQRTLATLPLPIANAATEMAAYSVSVDIAWSLMRRAVIAGEILSRHQQSPELVEIDAERVRATHERYRALEDRRRALVRDLVQHVWIGRQRQRLLATTGSRLNSAGAELRRRLTLRGEHAMRVRQVVAAGSEIADGDPLFDVRPVWMASPETVAQIFPRKPLFDVVVFDEASQCRLEEALPVLVRARRVVIAGDPKQLPPTRFFESALTKSQEDEQDLSEQGLFEEQQADVEDLLGAALNLEIEQCYLDVHYRSQNAGLIQFSNQSFYDKRLQPIPGHPKNRERHPPIRLARVDGVYEKRANTAEAREVLRIVRELLAREAPPSIGIACFNLVQRDAISAALDEAAAIDPEFAGRLSRARSRQGAASFEGLFVKNLENVQGDERDHMIISTTYGPDLKGRFYRRFGPLALAGGGRRLNVLVTRARQVVHLVTSIPKEVYSTLPPVESGRTPNGAWLLFRYLQYAEELAALYAAEGERLARATVAAQGTINVRQSDCPSQFAEALANHLGNEHGISSDVHWGNDGFCVDVALHHPTRPEDVTIGILCDGSRYDKAEDPVEWDLFRTAILQQQGWEFVRLWAPHFFRDPVTAIVSVQKAADAVAGREAPPASGPAYPMPPLSPNLN